MLKAPQISSDKLLGLFEVLSVIKWLLTAMSMLWGGFVLLFPPTVLILLQSHLESIKH